MDRSRNRDAARQRPAIAYTISDRDRWRRFIVLVLLVLAAASARWLFADGGVLVLLHDFGLASITRPHSRFG